MAISTINGNGTTWQLPSRGISIIGTLQEYSTYNEFILDASKSKFAWVVDATGDPTVKSGGALYRIEGKNITKIFEEESVDLEESIVITWDRITGRPLSTVNAIDESVARAHVHLNGDVLDKFSVAEGVLLFNGSAIATGSGDIDALRTELTNYINTKVSSIWVWKGSKSTLEEVQAIQNPEVGWVYQVGAAEYAYNGTNWEELGPTIALDNYFTSEQVRQAIATAKSETLTAAALDAEAKDTALHTTISGEIATAKSEAIAAAATDAQDKADLAQSAAEATAAADATAKANAAEQAAKTAAEGYANAAKEAAITAAEADAQTKANTAQNAAIAAAATAAQAKDEALHTTITGEINAAKSEAISVASGVAQSLNGHIDNTNVHVSVENRTNWDDAVSKAHVHNTTTSYTYIDEVYGCTEKVEAYKEHNQITIPDENHTAFSFIDAVEAGYVLIGDSKFYWIYSGSAKYTGTIVDLTGTLADVEYATASNNVWAVIAGGKLYVQPMANQTNISQGGNLLGSTVATQTGTWTVVDNKDWLMVTSHTDAWLAIDADGILYSAGSYTYGRQGVETYTGINNTLTPVTLGGNTPNDWIDAQVGRYYYLGMRGIVADDGTKQGTIYAWGSTVTGCVGNGVSYRQDMKKAYGWTLNGETVYTFATKPTAGDLVYTFNGVQVIVGPVVANSDGSSITVGEATYTRDNTKDIDPNTLGELKPVALAVPTFNTDGEIVSTAVYDDWFAMSAGWYHAGALRKNNLGETEIYLWGENEYGQLGTGRFVDATLTQSSLTELAANEVEIISWPTKLTTEQFPYTDAVEINCTHYGTFIKRANGKIYFAGCNKRNYLGTGTFSENTAFIPKFTELSTRFTGNDLYVASYGSLILRKSPRLSGEVDPVIAATLSGSLKPENIDNAITSAHNHSIGTTTIDAAAILISQFAADIPNAIIHAHTHGNLADLNSISVRNGNLYLNGIMFAGGAGDSGTAVVVDPSNVQLDQITDVTGLCNLAGGFGLEIIAYNKVSDTESYILVAPTGNVVNKYGRYVTLYKGTEELLKDSEQNVGLYGVPSNSTSSAKYITCTKDIVDMMTTVRKSSSASLNLYLIDTAHASNPTSGTLYKTLTYSQIGDVDALTWKMETGSVVQAYGEYLPIKMLDSVGYGSFENEEVDFQSVYDFNGAELITKDQFENGTYYFEDGTEVENIGSMVIPIGSDDDGGLIYHTIYSDSELTIVAIPSDTIKTGLFIKDGTMLVKVRQYMIPEKFDESLFVNGTIYIHPSNTNFSGMANQAYTYDTASVVYNRETTAVDGVYPIKSVILKLNRAITNGDTTTTTEFVPKPGSLVDPMVASIYSPNRYSTTSISGEYNSAIGYNSNADGNQVTVAGDFATGKGLQVFNTGDKSHAEGLYLTVFAPNSNVNGSFNIVGGDTNFVLGSGNITHSYYGFVIGDGNQAFGMRPFIIGMKNTSLTMTEGSTLIGYNNISKENGKGSISVGTFLRTDAEDAVVIGGYCEVNRYTGNFPGYDTDVLNNITAEAYATTGYDTKGIYNKNGLFFGAGEKDSNNFKSLIPFQFTKFIMRPNNAFFSASTGATNRSNIEPYIYEPYLQWGVTGVINMKFTEAISVDQTGTKFDVTERDGGRVKTFDPGIVKENTDATPVFDFAYGTRWKLAGGGTYLPIPKNFVDGAEAYVIVYAGATVSWSAFENGGNSDQSEDSNHFDGITWVGGSAPRAVDSFYEGFQMIKLMIVDNFVVAQLLADTCSNVAATSLVEEGEDAAAQAGDDASDVTDMTNEATDTGTEAGNI